MVYLGYYLDIPEKGPATKSVNQLQAKFEPFDKLRKTDDVSDRIGGLGFIMGRFADRK